MIRDTVTPPARRGAAGLPRRRALLRRLPRQPRLRARGAAHGVRGRRRGDRAVRHQRRDAARLGRRRRPRRASSTTGVRVGIHAPQRHRLRGRQHRWPPSTPAPPTCRAASTATASAPATPTWSPSWPTSSSSWTGRCCRPGCSRDVDPDRARGRRGHQLPARVAAAVRRQLGVHPQGRPARQRDQGRPEPLPAHGARRGVGNDMRLLVSDMAGRASIELKGRELGFDLSGDRELVTADHRPGQGARDPRATPSRPPTRRSSCCWSRRSRARARRTSRSSPGG